MSPSRKPPNGSCGLCVNLEKYGSTYFCVAYQADITGSIWKPRRCPRFQGKPRGPAG